MTQYTHRMTLVVPESLMSQANQLALIAGESPDDVHTFMQPSYQDSVGNKYAVCSTVIKPIVLSLLSTPLADSVLHADNADVSLAQAAMDKIVMYVDGVIATPDSIVVGIDIEPHELFSIIGLTSKEIILDIN